MKALTIRQPWADAIAHGEKRIENRSRRTNYTGPVLIHAGLAEDIGALPQEMTAGWAGTRGAIIAIADLVGCHQADRCCKPWGFPGCWHWVLSDVRALTTPLPAKGQLGLWTPSEELLAAAAWEQTKTRAVA